MGYFRARKPIETNISDHVAATLKWGHGFENLGFAPQNAEPGWAEQLMGREGEEIGTKRLHIGWGVGHGLAAVNNGNRSSGVRCITK